MIKRRSAKGEKKRLATFRRLNQLTLSLLLVVFLNPALAQELNSTTFAGFRHVDSASLDAPPIIGGKVVLVADQDFAPWSFVDAAGVLQGIAVDLARSACVEAGLSCELKPISFERLQPALRSGEAQGIVAGPKLDGAVATEFALTRPFFQTLGRFVVRTGSPLAAPDIRTLAGRRIGFRANATHAHFLETYYARSSLTPFDTSESLLDALRTGQVDIIFGDSVQLTYWLNGKASRGCCSVLGKAFVDRKTFTRSMSFVLGKQDPSLRLRFDAALDQLEVSGKTGAIFARYLPNSVW